MNTYINRAGATVSAQPHIDKAAEAVRELLVGELQRWIGTAALELSRTLSPELAKAVIAALKLTEERIPDVASENEGNSNE